MTNIDLISTKDACRILDVDKTTISRWINADPPKLVPAYRGAGKNGILLFSRADIDKLAKSRA